MYMHMEIYLPRSHCYHTLVCISQTLGHEAEHTDAQLTIIIKSKRM